MDPKTNGTTMSRRAVLYASGAVAFSALVTGLAECAGVISPRANAQLAQTGRRQPLSNVTISPRAEVQLATVHVNFRPLSGQWDGHAWDPQTARCSNNFMSGPTPPVPPSGVSALRWEVDSDEANAIGFNVSVDLPGTDEIIFTGLSNHTVTAYLPTPAMNDPNRIGHWNWNQYYNRGIYIASVSGAHHPFFVRVIGT